MSTGTQSNDPLVTFLCCWCGTRIGRVRFPVGAGVSKYGRWFHTETGIVKCSGTRIAILITEAEPTHWSQDGEG